MLRTTSISAALVIALALLAGGRITSPRTPAASANAAPAPAPSVVFETPDNTWFEGEITALQVSPDGEWALFRRFRAPHLVSLKSGKEDPARLNAGFTRVDFAAFCGRDSFARHGQRGNQQGWFISGESSQLTSIPDDAILICSADAKQIAYFPASKSAGGIFIGVPSSVKPAKHYSLPAGDISSIAFSPDSASVYAVLTGENGSSTLVSVTPDDTHVTTIATDLDMMENSNAISLSRDGQHAYLALASPGVPDNKARHEPYAKRWLAIYDLDLKTGARHKIISSDQDNYDPNLASSAAAQSSSASPSLFWLRIQRHKGISVFPATTAGATPRELLPNAELPIWSFDGRRISYLFNFDRIVAGALPMDAGVISVDPDAHVTSPHKVIVAGYHEDFPAAFSPDGHWIAFHSHRSPTPVPFYLSAGHTDDIYLRLADDNSAPEIRLTDFGWEAGPPYWSPDGRKLIFSSWVKGGEPGIDKVWILTLDPATGKVLDTQRLHLPAALRSAHWTAWSPDGKQIAIEDDQGADKRSLWILNADGSDPHKILDYHGTTYGSLDWTPDGKNIVYSGLSGEFMQILSVPVTGGTPKLLTHDAATLIHPRVSPDGRWIACSRMEKTEQILRGSL